MKIAGRKTSCYFYMLPNVLDFFCPTISIIKIKWSKVVKSASKCSKDGGERVDRRI